MPLDGVSERRLPVSSINLNHLKGSAAHDSSVRAVVRSGSGIVGKLTHSRDHRFCITSKEAEFNFSDDMLSCDFRPDLESITAHDEATVVPFASIVLRNHVHIDLY